MSRNFGRLRRSPALKQPSLVIKTAGHTSALARGSEAQGSQAVDSEQTAHQGVTCEPATCGNPALLAQLASTACVSGEAHRRRGEKQHGHLAATCTGHLSWDEEIDRSRLPSSGQYDGFTKRVREKCGWSEPVFCGQFRWARTCPHLLRLTTKKHQPTQRKLSWKQASTGVMMVAAKSL